MALKITRFDDKYVKRLKKTKLEKYNQVIEECRPQIVAMLAKLEPPVAGFLMADVLACWLSGFRNEDDLSNATGKIDDFRKRQFLSICTTVIELVKDYDREFKESGLPQ